MILILHFFFLKTFYKSFTIERVFYSQVFIPLGTLSFILDMVFGFLIHSFQKNPNLSNYVTLMQQNPRKPFPSIYDSNEEDFALNEEPPSVDVYLSHFYENLDVDSDTMDDLSHHIASKVSSYHQHQLQNLVANSDIEYQIQSKHKYSQQNDSNEQKYDIIDNIEDMDIKEVGSQSSNQ